MGTDTTTTTPAASTTIEMPRLGGYADMKKLTGRSRATIYKWVWKKKLRPGVYLGNGEFNISWIKEILDKHETFFLKRN